MSVTMSWVGSLSYVCHLDMPDHCSWLTSDEEQQGGRTDTRASVCVCVSPHDQDVSSSLVWLRC